MESVTTYLELGSLVGVRVWTRRDRRAIGRWPASVLPPHWRAAAESPEEPRISFAVDALPASMLIGRITLRPRGPAAHLSIYLHPEWCGQGYGPAALLVFQRLQVREGAKLLTLDVATDNHRAIAAYRRAGWSFTSSLVRGEHTYLKMEMELAPNTANCGGDTADDRG